jgi:hypothetical protein
MAITPTKQIRYCLLGVARGLYIRVRDENDCLHYRGSYRLHRSALCTMARSPFDGREPASRLSPEIDTQQRGRQTAEKSSKIALWARHITDIRSPLELCSPWV